MFTNVKLLINYYFAGGVVNRTVYVSNTDGDDNIPNCGANITSMCASIAHALTTLVYQDLTHLTILLDGRNVTNTRYEVETNIFYPNKILTLTLKPMAGSIQTPVVIGTNVKLIPLFGYSGAPTIVISNIDFERLLLVKFTTSGNTSGVLRLSNSKWSDLSGHEHNYSFIDGGGGEVKGVQVDVELTDFSLSSMLQSLSLIANYILGDTKWRITWLRGQLNIVGLKTLVKNSTFSFTDVHITESTPHSHFSIDLQGFDSVHLTRIHFDHETSGNHGTFTFSHSRELTISHTKFVSLSNNWQVIGASSVNSVNITNCTFQSSGTNTNMMGFSDNSFEFSQNSSRSIIAINTARVFS